MPARLYNITRPKNDGGPAVLMLSTRGHVFRMVRGHTATLSLDPEAHAAELRSLSERYKVTEAVAVEDQGGDFLKRKRRPSAAPSPAPIADTEPRAEAAPDKEI